MKKYSFTEGQIINDLGVIFIKTTGGPKHKGLFKCYCGKIFESRIDSVGRGETKSCSCYNTKRTLETHTKHGLAHSPFYKVWLQMKRRVSDPKCDSYKNYGGRGIAMFPPWIHDFQLFYDYVSALPHANEKGYTIDRKNNNGNYEPGNLRWATRSTQNINMRKKKNNTSGYTGVAPFRKKWQAYIHETHIGHFNTIREAVIARNEYIIKNNLPDYKIQEVPNE